jgi:hypothetical protein
MVDVKMKTELNVVSYCRRWKCNLTSGEETVRCCKRNGVICMLFFCTLSGRTVCSYAVRTYSTSVLYLSLIRSFGE